jgi:NADPH-dependent 2,4-dienoyl-CoA reductase/sulfur reductase-like enzyme
MDGNVRVTRVLRRSDHVVIVGAGLAGWRLCESLRHEGFEGKLTLVGDEPYAPYDRPPLSKNVLVGKWEPTHTTLATPELVASNDVQLKLGVAATSFDAEALSVHLADGTSVQGTRVVIATGTRARYLGYSADAAVNTLRNRNDVEKLLAKINELEPGSVVGVIGGGFIGAEAATALHTRGFVPIVLEAAVRPLVGALGDEVSQWLEGVPGQSGVELRNNQKIIDVVVDANHYVIQFKDESELRVRALIVGAGAVANVEWLASSSLHVDNGVVVDENLLVNDTIGAIGDVAKFRWKNTLGTDEVRIEHWQIAIDHAAHLAHHWVSGATATKLTIPYFWSDQYGKKIQVLGHAQPSDRVTRVSGSPEEAKWLALYSRDGIVSGIVTLSQPRALMLSKHLLEQPTNLDEALGEAPWAN